MDQEEEVKKKHKKKHVKEEDGEIKIQKWKEEKHSEQRSMLEQQSSDVSIKSDIKLSRSISGK
jgi:hypothetical protein